VRVFLVDGTYELFRHFFGQPSHLNADGAEVAAVRGVIGSVLGMLEEGATHVGVATDHVIESFRNDMWHGYKSSAGVPAELLAQFGLLEEALEELGVVVWAMVELEADDALASAAAVCSEDETVDQVLICTPDKDLAQCVSGSRVVQLDRRRRAAAGAGDGGWQVVDEEGVVSRFGVRPESIPDYLALVGDSADGYPGLPGWGAKSASAVLGRYAHLESIPESAEAWDVRVRGAEALAATLRDQRELALLFRDLATLRVDRRLLETPASLRWRGPRPSLDRLCERLDAPRVAERAGEAARRT
jgi:5'-3' exonuclease